MTVSSETSRVSYSGNAITTAFSTTFRFLAAADLEVILVNDTTGAETTQILNTNYTVAGVGDSPSGTVNMTVAPATGETLVIVRSPSFTQALDYIENGPFPAESHERGLDLLTMLAQKNKDGIDRSIRFSDGDTSGASLILPSPVALKGFKYNAAADAIILTDEDPDAAGASAAAAAASAAAAAADVVLTNADVVLTGLDVVAASGFADASAASAAASAASADKLVASYVVTSSEQVITFSGLNLETDGGFYDIIINGIVGGTATSSLFVMNTNNDFTATNYNNSFMEQQNTTLAGSRLNDALINTTAIDTDSKFAINIDMSLNSVLDFISADIRGIADIPATPYQFNGKWSKVSASNVTRIDFTATDPDGFGVGTTIKIFKK